MDVNVAVNSHKPDLVIPATLVAALALILPPLQTQAWWLILPSLICLVLRWQVFAFVLLFSAMTYADSWGAGVYFLAVSLLLLMRMHSNPAADIRAQLFGVLRQLLLALPILLVIMLLMLAAGNRWSAGGAPNRAGTGISESMTPGSVSELANNRALAMRVRFEGDGGADLQPQSLYWRGLVLEDFDGRSWTRNYRLELDLEPIPAIVPSQQRVQYQVTLEPTRQSWLYGLHEAHTGRPQTYRDVRGMLITTEVLRQRVRYPLTSITPQAQQTLNIEARERNLALPAGSNPETRQWVDTLRSQFPDDRELSAAVLHHFNEQAFYYTLTPALTGQHSVDDFLFGTRQGFCEHYAGALAFVLRAAGIPARIVVGYQGGDHNPITDHWSVYQYNAHAWVEAWLPDNGWSQLDPTAYVAPDRILLGMDAWLASLDDGSQRWLRPATRLRLQLATIPGYHSVRNIRDSLQYGWNLGLYDSEGNLRSEALNERLEAQGLGNLPLWLLAALLLLVALRALWLGRRRQHKLSPAMRQYRRLDARLRKLGLQRRPSETILAHLTRVAEKKPEEKDHWQALAAQLTAAEYDRATAERNSQAG